VRDCAGDTLYSAVSWHRARVRLFAVSRSYPGDVYRHRGWHERALSAFERATRLVTLFAKARPLDAASETVHGLSATGNAAVSALRARRSAWCRGCDLGKLFSARDQCRMLDERRVHFADSIGREAKHRAHAHTPAPARQRHLFYRRQISVCENCVRRFTTPRWVAGVHP